MGNWSNEPSYTELDHIMAQEATRVVGLTAEQFNKVLYNIAYLKKMYGLYKCEIGTITVNYGAPGTNFDVDIVHRQSTVGGQLVDYLDFIFTIATAKITTTASTHQIEPTEQPRVDVTPTKLLDNTGYNVDFDFKIPRLKTTCTENENSGVIRHTLSAEEDVTFHSEEISKLIMTIPSTVTHGFYSGVNFKVGATIPEIIFVNNTNLPLKLMKRGVSTSGYEFNSDKTELLVIICDGLNIYCNLIEV